MAQAKGKTNHLNQSNADLQLSSSGFSFKRSHSSGNYNSFSGCMNRPPQSRPAGPGQSKPISQHPFQDSTNNRNQIPEIGVLRCEDLDSGAFTDANYAKLVKSQKNAKENVGSEKIRILSPHHVASRLPSKELGLDSRSHKSTVLSSNRSHYTGHSSMISRYNFRQLITSPQTAQQVEFMKQPQILMVEPGVMFQRGYQLAADSTPLRTDEDEITSQTLLLSNQQRKLESNEEHFAQKVTPKSDFMPSSNHQRANNHNQALMINAPSSGSFGRAMHDESKSVLEVKQQESEKSLNASDANPLKQYLRENELLSFEATQDHRLDHEQLNQEESNFNDLQQTPTQACGYVMRTGPGQARLSQHRSFSFSDQKLHHLSNRDCYDQETQNQPGPQNFEGATLKSIYQERHTSNHECQAQNCSSHRNPETPPHPYQAPAPIPYQIETLGEIGCTQLSSHRRNQPRVGRTESITEKIQVLREDISSLFPANTGPKNLNDSIRHQQIPSYFNVDSRQVNLPRQAYANFSLPQHSVLSPSSDQGHAQPLPSNSQRKSDDKYFIAQNLLKQRQEDQCSVRTRQDRQQQMQFLHRVSSSQIGFADHHPTHESAARLDTSICLDKYALDEITNLKKEVQLLNEQLRLERLAYQQKLMAQEKHNQSQSTKNTSVANLNPDDEIAQLKKYIEGLEERCKTEVRVVQEHYKQYYKEWKLKKTDRIKELLDTNESLRAMNKELQERCKNEQATNRGSEGTPKEGASRANYQKKVEELKQQYEKLLKSVRSEEKELYDQELSELRKQNKQLSLENEGLKKQINQVHSCLYTSRNGLEGSSMIDNQSTALRSSVVREHPQSILKQSVPMFIGSGRKQRNKSYTSERSKEPKKRAGSKPKSVAKERKISQCDISHVEPSNYKSTPGKITFSKTSKNRAMGGKARGKSRCSQDYEKNSSRQLAHKYNSTNKTAISIFNTAQEKGFKLNRDLKPRGLKPLEGMFSDSEK